MAARSHDTLSRSLVKTFTVKAAAAVTKGMPVIFGAADTDVEDAGANGLGIGIALATAAAGARVDVALSGYSIVECLVGTGGATRGAYAIAAANGLTDQVIGGGTVVKHIHGRFLQSGVVGDRVGLLLGGFAAGGA